MKEQKRWIECDKLSPKEAQEPGGKAAAELKGDGEVAVDMRDLALEAAFTSMSLRERWRAPGVEDTLEPITLPEKTLQARVTDMAKWHVCKHAKHQRCFTYFL